MIESTVWLALDNTRNPRKRRPTWHMVVSCKRDRYENGPRYRVVELRTGARKRYRQSADFKSLKDAKACLREIVYGSVRNRSLHLARRTRTWIVELTINSRVREVRVCAASRELAKDAAVAKHRGAERVWGAYTLAEWAAVLARVAAHKAQVEARATPRSARANQRRTT